MHISVKYCNFAAIMCVCVHIRVYIYMHNQLPTPEGGVSLFGVDKDIIKTFIDVVCGSRNFANFIVTAEQQP